MTTKELLNKIIGARIYNGVALAKKLGVPYQTLNSWKKGTSIPRARIENEILPKLEAIIAEYTAPSPEPKSEEVFASPSEFFAPSLRTEQREQKFLRSIRVFIHRGEVIVDEAIADSVRETTEALTYTNARNEITTFNKQHVEMYVIGPIIAQA